jgi:hypothetical protein
MEKTSARAGANDRDMNLFELINKFGLIRDGALIFYKPLF